MTRTRSILKRYQRLNIPDRKQAEQCGPMQILVAEDDLFLSQFLEKLLKAEGYGVDTVHDARACRENHVRKRYDLLLLDLRLPLDDGIETVEFVTRGNGPAVVVVTGDVSYDTAVRCFDLGVQDYIRKPLSPNELVARCKVVLRRRSDLQETTLSVGLLRLNRGLRTVHYGQIPIELTMKEFSLLELLVAHKGEYCPKDMIMQKVWQARPGDNANIAEVYVRYLRKKLGSAGTPGCPGVVIETLKGEGYRIREQTS